MGNAYLQARGVSKKFGSFVALDGVSFEIARGEFVCFLGPSGCGKTTLLRCIAGLETQSDGTIFQDGKDISTLPTAKRDFGIVFQSYALFPNLTVAQNIGFGLVNAGAKPAEIAQRVTELVQVVSLAGQESKYPAQLSGGQQQRCALARALAPRPGLLLLDEPLSALDAKVRAHLRREIMAIQKRLGVTTIMVTHDQEEAQTMADRIIVMRDGRIEQIGSPDDIYERPASPFVADFIGVMNIFDGVVAEPGKVACGASMLSLPALDLAHGTPVSIAIRPEDVEVGTAGGEDNVIGTSLTAIETLGSFRRLYLDAAADGLELRADVTKAVRAGMSSGIGDRVFIRLPPQRLRAYRKAG